MRKFIIFILTATMIISALIFPANAAAPEAVTSHAEVHDNGAVTLYGYVTKNGGYYIDHTQFSYSNDGYRRNTEWEYVWGHTDSHVYVAVTLYGLDSGTYSYQFSATNQHGTAYGQIETFTVSVDDNNEYTYTESEFDFEVYQQHDTSSDWYDVPYGWYYNSNNKKVNATVSSSGCGPTAFANAVRYKSGRDVNPGLVAEYALNCGARINNVGTSIPTLLEDDSVQEDFQISYSQTTSSIKTLKSELNNGAVALVGVYNSKLRNTDSGRHIIAIVEYDSDTDKYLILDSYITKNHKYTTDNEPFWASSNIFSGESIGIFYVN